jgi:hypothetical protein
LKGYYTKNTTVHLNVTVLEFLLAEAIPATTLPMGANPLGDESAPWNIDMSKDCKTNTRTWPRPEDFDGDGKKDFLWYHSDYKDLPYKYTYKFYEKIVDYINSAPTP